MALPMSVCEHLPVLRRHIHDALYPETAAVTPIGESVRAAPPSMIATDATAAPS